MKNYRLSSVAILLIIATCIFWGEQTSQGEMPKYQVVDLGTLGGTQSRAMAINENGDVVGSSFTTNNSRTHAFIFQNGSTRDLGTMGGNNSEAYGINNKGEIVGRSQASGSSQYVAYWLSNGVMHNLGTLGGAATSSGEGSSAYAINENSQIVGKALIAGNSAYHPFIYQSGLMQDLNGAVGTYGSAKAINDNGDIVGETTIGGHAFLYSNGIFYDLGTFGGLSSRAVGINNRGQLVGDFRQNANGYHYHSFIFTDGVMEDIGSLGAYDSFPQGINSLGQIVGNSTTPTQAFLYQNGAMYSLSGLVDADISPGWSIEEANAINDVGQIAGRGVNPLGQRHAILLNPLPVGWKEVITNTPSRNTFGTPPARKSGKDNLIVITHGYIPPWDAPGESTAWVDSMSNSIAQYLTVNGLSNWQVAGYKWIDGAEIPLSKGGPHRALNNAKQDGKILGEAVAIDGWSHIHFIGHSAGAGIIQSATAAIKSSASSNTTIHCTFLDPFVGLDLQGADVYGLDANWSEQYFSHDLDTIGGSVYKVTESNLEHAYNVNVTQLNKVKELRAFVSAGNGVTEPCYRTVTSHGWPVDFYSNTIAGNVTAQYQDLGFPLSKEGGNWAFATNTFLVGNNPARVLGTPDTDCISYATVSPQEQLRVAVSQSSVYQEGDAIRFLNGLQLTTHSPSWLSAVVSVTNSVNFVTFDARFSGTNGSEGLLSIYWDATALGSLDERAVQSGFQRYTFVFPVAQANSTHMLGFRIDPFTNIQSSVIVTNITLGLASSSQPFRLSATTNFVGDKRVFELNGQAGINYMVEGSTNLINWEAIAILVNTNGLVRFYDQSANNFRQRYYRAVAPF